MYEKVRVAACYHHLFHRNKIVKLTDSRHTSELMILESDETVFKMSCSQIVTNNLSVNDVIIKDNNLKGQDLGFLRQ
jgi:hypothetical protein